MNNFTIQRQWTENLDCELSLFVGDKCLTLAQYDNRKDVSTSVNLPADRLAYWFMENWEELTTIPIDETDRKTDVDWLCSHYTAAIGGGYIWPNILFEPTKEGMKISSEPSLGRQWIKYLGTNDIFVIPLIDFKKTIFHFVRKVIFRALEIGQDISQISDAFLINFINEPEDNISRIT